MCGTRTCNEGAISKIWSFVLSHWPFDGGVWWHPEGWQPLYGPGDHEPLHPHLHQVSITHHSMILITHAVVLPLLSSACTCWALFCHSLLQDPLAILHALLCNQESQCQLQHPTAQALASPSTIVLLLYHLDGPKTSCMQ